MGCFLTLDFKVSVEKKGNHPLVSVIGELDLHTCSKLNDTLISVLENATDFIVLNLEDTQYMDSTALGTIARMAKTFSAQNGEVRIVCQKSHILKLFTMSGLLKKNISVFDSEENAVADFA